jgi:hypothetical protein
MDSVFYFQDPMDDTKMKSIFLFHSWLAKDCIKSETLRMKGKYDRFDLADLATSKAWLIASLDNTLKAGIRHQMVPNLTGPKIISEVQLDSIRSLRKKEGSIEQLLLSKYPAENVRKLNAGILTPCNKLERLSSSKLRPKLSPFTLSSAVQQWKPFSRLQLERTRVSFWRCRMLSCFALSRMRQMTSTRVFSIWTLGHRPTTSLAKAAGDKGGAPPPLADRMKIKVEAPMKKKFLNREQSGGRGNGGNGNNPSRQKCYHCCGKASHYSNKCPDEEAGAIPRGTDTGLY